MNEIYDINNDKYLKKYLKYKIKYLELHNELEGGVNFGIKSAFTKLSNITTTGISKVKGLVDVGLMRYTPESEIKPKKLKESNSDNTNYIEKLIEIIQKYPLGYHISHQLTTDTTLLQAKNELIEHLSDLNKDKSDNIEKKNIQTYLENIETVYKNQKEIFTKYIYKYIEFAQKKYILYYNSKVGSYNIIDRIYRELLKKHKPSFTFILIDYNEDKEEKEKKGEKKKNLLDQLKKSFEYKKLKDEKDKRRTFELIEAEEKIKKVEEELKIANSNALTALEYFITVKQELSKAEKDLEDITKNLYTLTNTSFPRADEDESYKLQILKLSTESIEQNKIIETFKDKFIQAFNKYHELNELHTQKQLDYDNALEIIKQLENIDNGIPSMRAGENVIPLEDNSKLNSETITYNDDSKFKSTVLITPDQEYYYELSILFKLFDISAHDDINKKISEIFNIYIHLEYIKSNIIDTNIIYLQLQSEFNIIIRYFKELLVSTEIKFNYQTYKMNTFNNSEIFKLLTLNISELFDFQQTEDNLIIDEIKKFFNTKIPNEIMDIMNIKKLIDDINKILIDISKKITKVKKYLIN